MFKVLYKYSIHFTIVWAVVIFILCATPSQYIPSLNWLEVLSFDKFVHASIFFILCNLLFVVHIKYKQSSNFKLVYLVISIGYGILLEAMQATVFSNRSADWLDILANSFGCLMALFFYSKLKQHFVKY